MKLMKVLALAALAIVALNTSNAQANTRQCATVYQSAGFTGYSLDLAEGTQISDLGTVAMGDGGTWTNRITSVVVAPGCTLVGYQYLNFGRDFRTGAPIGFSLSLHGHAHHHSCDHHEGDYHHGHHHHSNHVDLFGTYYDQKISSVTCYCN